MLKRYFLLLTLIAAILFFWPTLHFQPLLSQEDHGRDLYTFAQIAHGKLIYKDMWWVFGPFMPYYYAFFYLVFGFKISSVLLGKFILAVLCALFFYLASCEVMSIPWAFIASCTFMFQQNDFFYTYNHVGGIALILAILWLILRQFHHDTPRNTWGVLAACLVLGFIKINFGITMLAGTLFSFSIIEILRSSKSKTPLFLKLIPLYTGALLVLPLIWYTVYHFLISSLNTNELHQCLPYNLGRNFQHLILIPISIKRYLFQNLAAFIDDWLNFLNYAILTTTNSIQLKNPMTFLMLSTAVLKILIYPITCACIFASYWLSFTKKFENKKTIFWFSQLILVLFFILNLHEFLLSNIWYRSFWSQPFFIFFCFYMVSIAVSLCPQRIRILTAGVYLSLFILIGTNAWITAKELSTPDRFIANPLGQIYVGNETSWVKTCNHVTSYLNKNLKKNELFLALPYDCLYYFLTNKPSPTRQTIFFNMLQIQKKQELSILKELEKNKVNYVLLSNRIKSGSPMLGEFGKTYCPLIYHYIMDNFTPVYSYGGNWNAPAGWSDNQGVIILKRKSTLNIRE